ncbi:MAG: ATP phosphoribosyltransferase [Pseudomonadales bacterium]|nr:ATP phosphoribosyltransferase [Pseudomonadales bacterium]MCP5185373.1 ATP phosphoribosyltransferase [Pseudomonadales bacterium]
MSLTIALNRGRILKECLPLLARAGIEPLDDIHSSRKLIFDATGGYRLIVMRGSDVPTYVEHGVADVGITGKDTILEYGDGADFYERLDLGIGRCRLMVAAPVGADIDTGPLRVATKFVNVARSWYDGLGRQVTVIPLAGAIEIAPLTGLADVIVDIVDTGNTLRANGLEERERIVDISTRLIVNRASQKTRFDAVQTLVERLRAVTAPGS